jgi:hypothetical protein
MTERVTQELAKIWESLPRWGGATFQGAMRLRTPVSERVVFNNWRRREVFGNGTRGNMMRTKLELVIVGKS